MKSNKNFQEEKKLVKSKTSAKTVLDMFLPDSKKNFENGILQLLDILNDPQLDLLLERYTDLPQEYSIPDEEIKKHDLMKIFESPKKRINNLVKIKNHGKRNSQIKRPC